MKNYIHLLLIVSIVSFCSCKDDEKNQKAVKSSTVQEVAGDTIANNTFTNPILDSGADPWVIYNEGKYYYIKSNAEGIVLMRTEDITDLRNAESKIVWKSPETGDHSKNIWAPEIHNIQGKWYIYVAADDGDNRNHRMFVLENTATNPFMGAFVVKSKLKTDANDNWAIDGSIFEHKQQFYFIWSGWESPKTHGGKETQNIYIAQMTNPWTIGSDRVLISTPEYEWERNWDYPEVWHPDAAVYVNEGPQMLAHGDKVHIIYSASGCWTPYYALGMLTMGANANPMNPSSWSKAREPIFQQSAENKVYGTGHNCFFKSPDGTEDWMLYHANDTPTDGCSNKRSPRAQKISWTKDNYPNLGIPFPTSQRLKKPSETIH